MIAKIHKLPENLAESEKITINLGFVDLGHVDLLVRDGFYSNRTDLIRTAIRNQLALHSDQTKRSITRQTIELGLLRYTKSDLEALREKGEKLDINALGLVTIAADVTPDLALDTIASLTILGALHASKDVKAALAHLIS
jgi:Arc/MetJ-type ribon-helix-helix transcriptional regulator